MPDEGQEEFSRALESAIRFLKVRDRFSLEVRSKLIQTGFSEPAIDAVLTHLAAKHILDDERLIRHLVGEAQGGKPIGREKLTARLLARGAPGEQVSQYLSAFNDMELAEQALRRKPGSMKNKGAAGRFLASKGFDDETILTVLDRVFGDAEELG